MYHENIIRTNRDRMNDLRTSEYVAEIKSIMNNPFIKYLDLERYFEHEDPVLIHFLNKIGEATVIPSDMEIAAFKREMRMKQIPVTDKMVSDFIAENTKKYPILDTTTIIGHKYCILADVQNNQIIKVSEKQIKFVDE